MVYPSNPIEGVKLIYDNGDFLHDGDGCTDNRRFTISFLCENEALNVPDEEPVYELYNCDYSIEMKSIYGCPVECPIIGNPPHLCNNQGLCGYDFTNMSPRCFCYDKWEGDYCHIYVPNENVIAPSKELPTSSDSIINTFRTHPAIDTPLLNVTYDLTPMGLKGMAYRIKDIDGDKESKYYRPYIYYFGVFQPIDLENDEIPKSCKNASVMADRLPCQEISDDGSCSSHDQNGRDIQDHIYALQYDPGNGFCAYLGTTKEWNLYDELDSARGITINYQDGTWCGSRGINRGFKISLVCPEDDEEDAAPNINEEAFVEEDTEDYCEYTMEIKTTIACPYQCRTSEIVDGKMEYSVCSGKGICAADPNAGFVRCLCDDGWTGINCDELDTPQPSISHTLSPSKGPTTKPSRYPTLGVRVVNVTIPIDAQGNNNGSTGTGKTVTIVILVVVIIVFMVIVYFGYKKFKQREQVIKAELDEYKQMGNDEKHDLTTNKKGTHQFTTIDDHIANDKDEDE